MKSEVEVLEDKIRAANHGYAEGHPIMEDESYDTLIKRLAYMKPSSPLLVENWSDADEMLEKAAHTMPMGSQDKANTQVEFAIWIAKQPKGSVFALQHKLDGASIELQYVDGQLIRAVTRGDGATGDVVTANVRQMKGVPATVAQQWSGAVRGEVIMHRSVFQKHFKDTKANCRNAAVGILKKKGSSDAKHLSVIAYDVTGDFELETDKCRWLHANGFRDVWNGLPPTLCETEVTINQMRELICKARPALDYDIDGIVIKNNEVDRDDERLPRPTRQIAYKFDLDHVSTKLTDVIWQQSGKTYTPVAVFRPVTVAGATVERANLVNLARINELGLRIGSTIEVVRRGEVIPRVENAIFNPDDGPEIKPPKTCVTCGTPLVVDQLHVECPNETCPARREHKLLCWLETLGIKGIGPAIVHALSCYGVQDISGLYSLTEEHLAMASAGALGPLQIKNILEAIWSKTEISLAQLVAGYDLPGIGVSTMNDVVGKGYRTLERLMAASADELATIPGVGTITAMSIVTGIEQNLADMLRVLSSGRIHVLAEITEGVLLGKTVCFTGPLRTMSRDEAELQVKAAGGQAKSSVVKGLTYLVTNDPHSGSSKNKKAEAQGTAVINEEQFLALLKGE